MGHTKDGADSLHMRRAVTVSHSRGSLQYVCYVHLLPFAFDGVKPKNQKNGCGKKSLS